MEILSFTALKLVNYSDHQLHTACTFDVVTKPVQICHILLLTPTLEPFEQSRWQGLFVVIPFPGQSFSLLVLCISSYIWWYIVSYCLNLSIDLLKYQFLSKRKFDDSCLTWWRLLGSQPSQDLLGFNAWMLKLDINQWFLKPYLTLFILIFFERQWYQNLLVDVCVYMFVSRY